MRSKAKTEVMPEYRRGFTTTFRIKFAACRPLMNCRTILLDIPYFRNESMPMINYFMSIGILIFCLGTSTLHCQNDAIPSEALIYFINVGTGIERTSFGGALREMIVPDQIAVAQGIAIDGTHQYIYWTDWVANKIQRAKLDGTAIEDIVVEGLDLPEGITVDPIHEKMYWVDSGVKNIKRADTDGTNIEILVAYDQVNLDGIALDLNEQRMFWTEWGDGAAVGKVKSAALDGADVKTIIQIPGGILKGIDLDTKQKQVYWTDCSFGKIQRANYDGSDLKDLVADLVTPNAITLDLELGKMYWTDLGFGHLRRANLDGSFVEKILDVDIEKPQDLALLRLEKTTSTLHHSKQSILVFPNPTHRHIFLQHPFQKVEAQLFTNDSKMLFSKILTHTDQIDLSEIPSGSYLLRLNTPDFEMTYPIIKN